MLQKKVGTHSLAVHQSTLQRTLTAELTVSFRQWLWNQWPEREKKKTKRNEVTHDICACQKHWNNICQHEVRLNIPRSTVENTVLSKGQCARVTNKNKDVHISSQVWYSGIELVKCPCEQTEAFASLHDDSSNSSRFQEVSGMSQFTSKGENACTAVAMQASRHLTRRSYARLRAKQQ